MKNTNGQYFNKRGTVINYFTKYAIYQNDKLIFTIIGKDVVEKTIQDHGLITEHLQIIDLTNDNWLGNDCEFAAGFANN